MNLKNIRVGIDPYTDNVAHLKRVAQALDSLTKGMEVQIKPTYLLNFSPVVFSNALSPDVLQNIREGIVLKISELIQEAGIKDWSSPEILTCDHLSQRGELKYLADHLAKESCDLFVVNTHARTGVKRFFMGSFSENLLLRAQCPLLFVSPHTDEVKAINKTLFPTDFSKESGEVFDKLLESDFNIGEQLHLFSMTNFYHSPVTYAHFDGSQALEKFIEASNKGKEREAQEWKKKSESFDLSIEYEIRDRAEDLVDSIIQYSEGKNIDLIALGSFVSEGDLVFSGSYTREIVRRSDKPVLVWHGRKG